MILSPNPSKVSADHLKRNAYLYIRQSTLKQVMENTESTKRQYDLRHKGLALGWQTEQIIVIDTDQGQSGAQAADREGFQRLVAEVSLGKAGIVMGLEVSRLARNSTDWHRLLELCAMSHTLILDEEGVYDPNQYHDRLLLGLLGALSEAELHVLKARLQGGVINKAKRGELKRPFRLVLFIRDLIKSFVIPISKSKKAFSCFLNFFVKLAPPVLSLIPFARGSSSFPHDSVQWLTEEKSYGRSLPNHVY